MVGKPTRSAGLAPSWVTIGRARRAVVALACWLALMTNSPVPGRPQSHVAAAPALSESGFDEWRFGMTPDQVKGIKSCRRYQELKSNAVASVSCSDFALFGRSFDVDFFFTAGRLAGLDLLWRGPSESTARKDADAAVAFFTQTTGGGTSPQLIGLPSPVTVAEVFEYLVAHRQAGAQTTVRLFPVKPDCLVKVWIQIAENDRLLDANSGGPPREYSVSLTVYANEPGGRSAGCR